MGIIKDKLNEQIDQKGKIQFSDTTGTILAYNEITNTATIKFKNPNGEGTFRRENVPIANSLGGLTGSGIRPGAQCSISFRANNVYAPVITGVLDSFYQEKSSKDQGAYIVEQDVVMSEIPETISPMLAEWLDEDNDNPRKYINPYSYYADCDVDAKIYDMVRTLDKFSDKEQGITNLDTKSMIKLRENGDIDLFVSNNVGLRVSKKTQQIIFFGAGGVNIGGVDLNTEVLNTIPGVENNKPHKDENTGGNNPTVSDIIKVSKISDYIKSIEINIGEIEEVIRLTISITGNTEAFDGLNAKIKEFYKLKEQYQNADDSITTQEINELYDKMLALKNLFESELEQGRQALSLFEE